MSKYAYGPVASRRLGRSLGVDLVPMKTCNLNCVYCQLGPTAQTTMVRADYAPAAEVVADVRQRILKGPEPDFITLGGSGEPTLHRSFGSIAANIAELTDVPIALLTNGMLFYLPEVRAATAPVNLVLPSLDAGDEETFRAINRPHAGLTLEMLVSGLEALRDEFLGQIWLEVFIVEGLNTSDEQIDRISACIERIRPDRIQLNTAVRPPAESYVQPASMDRLEEICTRLGPGAEIIASGRQYHVVEGAEGRLEDVLEMIRRRPCTVDDVADGLGISRSAAIRDLRRLLDDGTVHIRQRRFDTYYEATKDS